MWDLKAPSLIRDKDIAKTQISIPITMANQNLKYSEKVIDIKFSAFHHIHLQKI